MDGLFELRDDPQSYLYYYYSKQLHFLRKAFEVLEVPFTLLEEWALQHSHPNLYLVKKLSYEAEYLSAILSFLPKQAIKSRSGESEIFLDPEAEGSILRKEKESWLLHKTLDNYLTPYFSRAYSGNS